MSPKVIIVGAGLVGSLNACFFARRGWDVEVYESRGGMLLTMADSGKSDNVFID